MKNKLSTITGTLLIGWAIYLNIPFSILGAIFDYPNILRRPAAEVLTQFQAGGIRLLAAWYAFALVALLFPFVALLLHRIRGKENETLWRLATASGILAGALQLLGLIRWVFVVPQLARIFSDPTSSQASKDATVVVFQALHQYAGVAIGEHLGQLFTALWVMFVAAASFHSRLFTKRQAVSGMLIAVSLLLGLVEGFATVIAFDPGLFGLLPMFSFVALTFWMISLGIRCLRLRSSNRRESAPARIQFANN